MYHNWVMQAAGAQVGPLPAELMAGQTQNPQQGVRAGKTFSTAWFAGQLSAELDLPWSSTARQDSPELSPNTEITEGCPSATALGTLALPRHQELIQEHHQGQVSSWTRSVPLCCQTAFRCTGDDRNPLLRGDTASVYFPLFSMNVSQGRGCGLSLTIHI